MNREELLSELRRESAKQDPMPATTIRLPRDVFEEMEDFAVANKLHFAVVLRRATVQGWEGVKALLNETV